MPNKRFPIDYPEKSNVIGDDLILVADSETTNPQYKIKSTKLSDIHTQAPVQSVNGKTGVVVLDTDDITEGTNKYVTQADKDKLANVPADTNSELSTINTNISNLQSDKADKVNVLELDNTTAFTPDADYEPSTKKYVDDNAGKVGTKEVNETAIGNDKILVYKSGADEYVMENKPAGVNPRILFEQEYTTEGLKTMTHNLGIVLNDFKKGKYKVVTAIYADYTLSNGRFVFTKRNEGTSIASVSIINYYWNPLLTGSISPSTTNMLFNENTLDFLLEFPPISTFQGVTITELKGTVQIIDTTV